MSQHLITQFINRSYIFKPFNDAKLVNHKLSRYQGSDRHNNSSPEDIAESTHNLMVMKKQPHQEEESKPCSAHIDVTV